MEEEARDGEGNRDRAVEWLLLFGRGVLQNYFGSFLPLLHSRLTQLYFHPNISNITLIGQYPLYHRNTHFFHNSIFFQHVLFSLSPVLCLLLWFRLGLCVYVISPLRYLGLGRYASQSTLWVN